MHVAKSSITTLNGPLSENVKQCLAMTTALILRYVTFTICLLLMVLTPPHDKTFADHSSDEETQSMVPATNMPCVFHSQATYHQNSWTAPTGLSWPSWDSGRGAILLMRLSRFQTEVSTWESCNDWGLVTWAHKLLSRFGGQRPVTSTDPEVARGIRAASTTR